MPIGWAIVIIVQWLVIIALAAVVLGVLRQVTPHLERAAESPVRRLESQGPAVGSKLPPFIGGDGGGDILTAAEVLGRPAVLLFLSATCAPCVNLAGEMGASDLGELVNSLIVVIDPNDLGRLRPPTGLRVLTMPPSQVAEVFAVRGRPFAVTVDADGVVRATRWLNTVAQLRDLASSVMRPAVAVKASDNHAS
jgi:hypothetical protein